MSIPTTDREQIVISSTGSEKNPDIAFAKGTLWCVYSRDSNLYLKEYNGDTFRRIRDRIQSFCLTVALDNNLSVMSDRFWLWEVDHEGSINLIELEPFLLTPPVVTYSKIGILSNVTVIQTSLSAGNIVRIAAVTATGELKLVSFTNIRNSDPPAIGNLTWSPTRLSNVYSFFNATLDGIEITYSDVASPPNIYTDSYLVNAPNNFIATQVGTTNEILLSWDAASGADEYLLDCDTNPAFPSPTSVYTVDLNYSDNVPSTGAYYYRIRGLNNTLLLQSAWSDTEEITLTLVAEFSGSPTTIFEGESVSFTDESTPTGGVGFISSWDWDFGDSSAHSTEQNPSHQYSTIGTYTVTLLIESGLDTDDRIRTNYITVLPSLVVDFSGSPESGEANLTVEFTDLTTGDPISWEWDFGDGTPAAYIDPPALHTYTKAGQHTVSLTVYDGVSSSTETKDQYIKVQMIADFTANNVIGPADLVVSFSDMTLGEPTSWDWDFGDGSPHSTEQNPTHVYELPGHFTVTLVASNGTEYSEQTDTEIKADLVTVYTNADFMGTPRTGYQTLNVQFVDTSTGYPTTWYWDFGDGNFSVDQNPLHLYTSPGRYTVSLTVSSSFNSDSEIKVGYIVISGTATPDIAPEPDILLYLNGNVEAYKNVVGSGLRMTFRRNISSS